LDLSAPNKEKLVKKRVVALKHRLSIRYQKKIDTFLAAHITLEANSNLFHVILDRNELNELFNSLENMPLLNLKKDN